MQFLRKYLLLLFILENIFALYVKLSFLSSILFYAILALGLSFFFAGSILSKESYHNFRVLYLLSAVFICYEFTLGLNTLSVSNLLYLLAKLVSFIIIIEGLTSNFKFYFKDIIKPIGYIIAILVIGGYDSSAIDAAEAERLRLGFGNENAASIVSATGFACILFSNRYRYYDIVAILICLYGIVGGGGRNALLICFVMTIFRFGISAKTVLLSVAVYGVIDMLFPYLGLNSVGLERAKETMSGKTGSNREMEQKAAWMMIAQRPFSGWGYMAENVGKAAKVSMLGSHNGYIDYIKFMGYPFSFLLFSVLGKFIFSFLSLYRSKVLYVRYHLAFVVAIIFATFFEAFMVGIHELPTTMFFISLATLSIYKNKYAYYERKNH